MAPVFLKSIAILAAAGICGGLAWSAAIFVSDTVTRGELTWQPADLVYPVAIGLVTTMLIGSATTLLLSVRPFNAMTRFVPMHVVSFVSGMALTGVVILISPGAIVSALFSGAVVVVTHFYLSGQVNSARS